MYEPEIIVLLNIASALIAEAYSKDSESDIFGQEGILTGKEIVLSYINHGECRVAIEHLLYMIHESGVSYPKDKLMSLHEISKKLEITNSYV